MKTRRHSKILELIQDQAIETQEELLRQLKAQGFDVTQATVSRDIKELRLVKTLGEGGRYHYATAKKGAGDISTQFFSLFSGSVLTVEYAGNMVVIKCMTGMAQAVCAAMDSMHWDGVVGTLAGDDTIFVVVRNESRAVDLVSELKKLITEEK
ncbi:MAG TPA: arginine repressor [Candidatus Gallacutalibacter stercoravium]|nr:arginine repressor [Candidatus Gallacutalibacter stercoravium]